jgi:V-type H+-transporting ATPase subunit F
VFFKKLLEREDIGIIMISQHVAEMIRNLIAEHVLVIPTIMEIPSKDFAYDPLKDNILVRAAKILYGNEVGMEKLKQIETGF